MSMSGIFTLIAQSQPNICFIARIATIKALKITLQWRIILSLQKLRNRNFCVKPLFLRNQLSS